MSSLQLLTGPLAQAVGWALLHLLWQATIVAGILAAVLALMSRQTANARYIVSCGALALVFAMFVATTFRAYDPAAEPIVITTDVAAAPDTIKVPLAQLPVLIAESAAVGFRDGALAAAASARDKLPSIVAIWLAGVVLLSARLLVSWMRAKRLVHRASRPASREWQRVAAHLSEALGLRRAVTLLESAAVEVPSVIGSLRPIILLPASALTGMTPAQIEMVLAHEMAHIRRHDFLINLLQAVVETLMFYHPAVWWMSRRVRIERENCCDDLAVAVCGDPIQYARALTRLEELRASALPVVVAANGGSLIERIRRIAAGRAEGTTSSSRWAAAVAMLATLVIAVAVPSLPALAERQEKKKTEQAKKAETNVEVVETRGEAEAPEAESDLDFDMHDVDVDVEPVMVPEPPEIPDPPDVPMALMPGMAPVAIAGVPVPRPMIAPMAVPAPRIAVPPVPPPAHAPMALAAVMAADHEFEYEYEYEYGGDDSKDRELGSGGKLTVDELISLRASGVTPEYVNEMRAIFPGLTLRQVTSLSALGVKSDFIKEMRSAGFDVKTAREATGLKAAGVTPEFVRQMRGAGFEIKTARDATSLSAVGVTPSWVRDMRAAGVKLETARDAASMRAVGVTPEFVKKLAAAGYTNLTARELARLAAAGVDDDFIREMEQYRKKN